MNTNLTATYFPLNWCYVYLMSCTLSKCGTRSVFLNGTQINWAPNRKLIFLFKMKILYRQYFLLVKFKLKNRIFLSNFF